MPQTGIVYMVDRMTSDYAERFPLDVNGFIADVVQEFHGTEFTESHNTLLTLWNAVLGNRNECGNASLYPNRGGAHRPAAMKVWHKAGDYWRRGLRLGDTLPIIPPSCNITRLPDGRWIALFPKDKGLLNSEEFLAEPSGEAERRVKSEELTADIEPFLCRTEPVAPVIEASIIQSAPVAEPTPVVQSAPKAKVCRKSRLTTKKPTAAVAEHQTSAISHQTSAIIKAVGYMVAMSVALFVIYETGLLIPLGLIGLATGGILK